MDSPIIGGLVEDAAKQASSCTPTRSPRRHHLTAPGSSHVVLAPVSRRRLAAPQGDEWALTDAGRAAAKRAEEVSR